ncbi:MAG TPA: hypothetical protein PLE12_10605 [Propionicimonas sp.]|nr:hypothetical protein [Propionicimonas sp.]
MSALLIDDSVLTTPRQWVHVPHDTRPQAAPGVRSRPEVRRAPSGRPGGVAGPQVVALRPLAVAGRSAVPMAREAGRPVAGWQLTRRGLAVVVWGFLTLLAVATVVLVTGFLSVSNSPATPAVAAAQIG